MKENNYRMLRCTNCSFEEHRDYVSVLNLYGRGLLHLSIAHGMKSEETTQTVRALTLKSKGSQIVVPKGTYVLAIG